MDKFTKTFFITSIFILIGLLFQVDFTGLVTKEEYEHALVTRIVDGDTFEIQNGKHIRMICINTPEKGEAYSKEATLYLSELLLHKEVLLEKDKTAKDQFKRELRYVRSLENNHLYNLDPVEQGLARYYPIEPNTKHCPLIEKAQTNAQTQKKGIWSN